MAVSNIVLQKQLTCIFWWFTRYMASQQFTIIRSWLHGICTYAHFIVRPRTVWSELLDC